MLLTDAGPRVTMRMMMSVMCRSNQTILCPPSHQELFRVEERGLGVTAERDKEERIQGRETEKMPYPTLQDMREETDPRQEEAPRRQPQRSMDWTILGLRGHLTLSGPLKSLSKRITSESLIGVCVESCSASALFWSFSEYLE